jgi:ankyrin repeat protein
MHGIVRLGIAGLVGLWLGIALSPSAAAAGSPIAKAARDGDLAAVQALIQAHADVNLADPDGSTALLWAAYQADVAMTKALVAAGAEVDQANRYGVTPLLQASRTGDADVMGALLEAGADVHLAHPDGETPLMAAATTGRVEAVKILLEHGADPNAQDMFQQETALMRAVAEEHSEVVDLLLAAKADPNRQARITSLETRKNADHPSGGFTALMWAARNGNEPIVRKLVAAGADVNLRNGDDATAMAIAIVNDRFDMAATLVELGADVNDGSLYRAVEMRDATTDWFARDGSKLRADHPNDRTALDLIALLLDKGADPNKPYVGQMHSATMCCDTSANSTPFFRAAVAGDVEALKLLIGHGAELEWTPASGEGKGPGANANVGKTPLMVALKGGQGVPLSAGPGFVRKGDPPFREPSNREPAAAIQVLLEAGANPNAVAPNGDPVLHQAVATRDLAVLRNLIDGGASLTAKNKDGLTALEVAEKLKPDDPNASPFGPQRKGGNATPEEVVALLREAAQNPGAQARVTP